MILQLLADSALRSFALAVVVWAAIRILRPRSARLRANIWAFVLTAAVAMPLLVRWPPIRIPALLPVGTRASQDRPRSDEISASPTKTSAIPTESVAVTASAELPPHQGIAPEVPWLQLASGIYLVISFILVLRIIIGLLLTQLTWKRALPITNEWALAPEVRETAEVTAPAAIGFGMLFPPGWRDWESSKLLAVLAHERSHVVHGDFYVRLLSRLHVALFWFSPLAWWLSRHLSELLEAASDDEALIAVPDRSLYAEALLFFATKPQRSSYSLPMARPATVSQRVERILAESFAPARASARQYLVAGVCLSAATALTAGFSLRAQTTDSAANAARSAGEPRITQDQSNSTWSQFGNTGEPYVIVSGDSISMSGSDQDVASARSLHARYTGDYLWFLSGGKSYVITDAATLKRAKELFRPQQELGRQQEELGAQQEKLGAEQEKLGEQQARVSVRVPDMKAEIDSLNLAIEKTQAKATSGETKVAADSALRVLDGQLAESINKELTQEKLAEVQEHISELQSRLSESHGDLEEKLSELQTRFGDLQNLAGEEQSRLGDAQSKLGDQQSLLGEKQSKLGEEQSRLAEKASKQIRTLIDDAIRRGYATPVP